MVRDSVHNGRSLSVVGVAIIVAAAPVGMAQLRPDRTMRLLIDEGHNNFHTSSGGYAALTRLLRQNDFSVAPHTGGITPDALLNGDVLLTASPLPEPREVLLRKTRKQASRWSGRPRLP